jgi:hypothetical protein
MGKRPLILCAILFSLVLCVPALAGGGASWSFPNSAGNIHYVRAGFQVVAVFQQKCAGGNRQIAVQRVSSTGLGHISLLNKCGEFVDVSDPAAATNPTTHDLWVAFSATTPGGTKGKSYIFAASSSNSGASFHKRISLHTVAKKLLPPTVTLSSYAKSLFIGYSEFDINPALGKPNTFHIEQVDPRFGNREVMTGLAGYKVFPSSSSLKVFSSRDGVVAFWQSKSGSSYNWYIADSERINPYDVGKSVRMHYRGLIGNSNQNSVMQGEDGIIYRFTNLSKFDASAGNTKLTVTLDRWSLIQHKFIPASKAPLFTFTYKGFLNFMTPVIAETVGPDGKAYVAYRTDHAHLCTGGVNMRCVGATNGQSFASDISVAGINPTDGVAKTASVEWPVNASGNQAIGMAIGEGLLIASGGVRLVSPYTIAPVTKVSSVGDYEVGTPAVAYFESSPLSLN